MISGRVNIYLDAVIRVDLAGVDGGVHPVDVAVDTGFDGDLTLPREIIRRLGMEWLGSRDAELANGEVIVSDSYAGTALWHGRLRRVAVLQSEGGPVLGMSLLRGNRMTLEAWSGGGVVIEEVC